MLNMTTEVLILNKQAVVLAADSAVTTSPATNGEHPRYSKNANKLFELSHNGNVAIMIYGGAQIDAVPWELAIKLFRSNLGASSLPTLDLYLEQFLSYIRANATLFGAALLDSHTDVRFTLAVKHVLSLTADRDRSIFDVKAPIAARQGAWATVAADINVDLSAKQVLPSLSVTALNTALANINARVPGVIAQLGAEQELEAIDATLLTELAIRAMYTMGDSFLSSTGIVVAGYGDQDIFPGFRTVEVYGHIGTELLVKEEKKFHVTHTETSMIQGLAQKSMIDVFTDGFGFSLWRVIRDQNRKSMVKFVDELTSNGATIPQAAVDATLEAVHKEFMSGWTRENYRRNWQPLKDVLSYLSVQEMAHLAETLLTLESLKERVTSSSESVGGPIDVAAITKSEGLVWLKRKHFFNAEVNPRYFARLHHSLNP